MSFTVVETWKSSRTGSSARCCGAKNGIVLEFSIRLSRACLGKMLVFIYILLKNAVFRRDPSLDPEVLIQQFLSGAATATSSFAPFHTQKLNSICRDRLGTNTVNVGKRTFLQGTSGTPPLSMCATTWM